jgi:ADP-ribose pyrophosphatase
VINIKNFIEKKKNSTLIYDGQIVHLYRDDIELPNGKPATREVIRHIGAVCVLPLTEKNEVICVRQYRYPFEKMLLELPAGKLDSKDENPEEAARRELHEEAGVICENLQYIGDIYPSPAILDEVIRMYIATGLTYTDVCPDEDEFINVEYIPFDTLIQMVISGEICDGKTQAALLKAKLILNI